MQMISRLRLYIPPLGFWNDNLRLESLSLGLITPNYMYLTANYVNRTAKYLNETAKYLN